MNLLEVRVFWRSIREIRNFALFLSKGNHNETKEDVSKFHLDPDVQFGVQTKSPKNQTQNQRLKSLNLQRKEQAADTNTLIQGHVDFHTRKDKTKKIDDDDDHLQKYMRRNGSITNQGKMNY